MQVPSLRRGSDEPDVIEIFISFDEKSKNDRKLLDELQKRLHRLEEDKHVKIWSRDKIAGGQVIAEEINAHLKKAHIILLLISSDFLISSDCRYQMTQALKRHNSSKARVIPVLLRPALWSETPLSSLSSRILPSPDRPVAGQDRDNAFLDVERGIRRELEELIERKQSVAPFYTVVEMPPSIPITPPAIQQREEKVREVIARLTQPEVNAVVLTGMAGVGKSTLAALIRKYAENRAFSAKPLWFEISTNSSQVEIAKILYHHLNVPPPDFDNLEPSVLARLLFYALKTADESRLIIMDQFEKLLDMQTGEVRPECRDMAKWLEALNSQESACKFLLTSRHQFLQTEHLIHTITDRGLAAFEGKELLKELLTREGINATEAELSIAVKRCGGNAHALELLASLLKREDRSLTLTALFANQSLWIGEVVNNLLGYIYKEQLSETQRGLLIAFSVYRNAVPLEAAQIQMSTPIDARVIGKAREALLAQHLLRSVGQGRYQLHTLVADYGYQQINTTYVLANMATKQTMHEKAAQYYIQEQERSYPPPGKRREINDVQSLIEAVWHLHQSEQPRAVFELIRKESLFKDLKHWGNYTVLLDLYLDLLPVSKWSPDVWEEALISYHLGQVYDKLFQKEQAEKHFMRALLLYRKIKDQRKELEVLKYLAGIYQARGDAQKASACYEQALQLSKGLDDTRGEAMLLNKLAEMWNTFGKTDAALQYYNQALQIGGKTNDREQHAATRYLMGDVYHGQGKEQEARHYYEQALQIYRQEGDKGGEARTLNRLGETYFAQCNIFEAQKSFNDALETSEEIMDRKIKAQVLNNLAETSIAQGRQIEARQYSELALHLFREMGDSAGEGMALYNFGRSYIEAKDTSEKEKYCRSALKIFQDTADHKREGWVFNFLGVISYEQGKTEDALRYYATALEILKDVDDRKGQGWVLNNLGNVSFARTNLSEALTYFKQALEISKTGADCGGEGQKLYNIGKLYSNLRPHVALACFLLAREVFKNGMHLRYEEVEKSITSLHKQVGNEKFKAWQTMTLEQARKLIEKFLDRGL